MFELSGGGMEGVLGGGIEGAPGGGIEDVLGGPIDCRTFLGDGPGGGGVLNEAFTGGVTSGTAGSENKQFFKR